MCVGGFRGRNGLELGGWSRCQDAWTLVTVPACVRITPTLTERPAQEGQECRALGRLELEVTFHQFLLMGTA